MMKFLCIFVIFVAVYAQSEEVNSAKILAEAADLSAEQPVAVADVVNESESKSDLNGAESGWGGYGGYGGGYRGYRGYGGRYGREYGGYRGGYGGYGGGYGSYGRYGGWNRHGFGGYADHSDYHPWLLGRYYSSW